MHRCLHLSKSLLKRKALPLAVLVLAMLPWSSAFAARVAKVKGKSVLIEIESSNIEEGQKYFIMINGKKKGVVLISKVKGDKALGKLTKGVAEVDAGVEPTKKVADSGDSNAGSDGDLVPKSKKKKKKSGASSGANSNAATYIGAVIGYAMDSQTVPDPAGVSIPMSGSGYSLKGFADIPISGNFGVIARAGIEQFNLTGSSANLGGSVTTSIMYGTADGLLRYNFLDGAFIPYVAGGLGIHFPISKSSGILNVSQISSTTVFFLDLGADYSISDTTYVTFHGEYGYFPPSNNISTNFITIRGGVGFRY